MSVNEQRVEFAAHTGHTLRGMLVRPVAQPTATVVFAHCFTCDSRSHAATRISRALALEGCAVLRFDFTGLGASEGDFAETTFTTNIDDLVCAAGFLREQFTGPQILIGHSLGGAAVLVAASRLDGVAAVVTIGAPADPDHVLHLLRDLPDQPATDRLEVSIGGRPFIVGRNLIDDLRRQTPADAIAKLRLPLLVMHAPGDLIVGVDNARVIYDRARHPKSFVSLDGANHLLSEPQDSVYVASVVSAWVSRYLPTAPATAEATDSWNPVTVQEQAREGFAHTAGAATHRWMIDEPESVGGTDLGPTPYDVLLSGLGACTSMTMRLYARRQGWDYGTSRVELSHDRIHAEDCASCDTTSDRVDRITRTIHLDAALDEAQRSKLLEIADRCPVHRTLTGEIVIETQGAHGR